MLANHVILTLFFCCFVDALQKLQTIGEDFCGLDVNTPLGGGDPVSERPVATMNGVVLTAVAATSTGDFTVVFLGTSKGHLKKVRRRPENQTRKPVYHVREDPLMKDNDRVEISILVRCVVVLLHHLGRIC